MTGCDSNSAFFGHGRKKIFDVVKSSEEARTLLKSCGSSLDITKSTNMSATTGRVKIQPNPASRSGNRDEDSLFYQIKRGNYIE